MNRSILPIALFLLCITLFTSPSYGREPVLLQAMEDELSRSSGLKLEHEANPYFISYLVRDASTCIIAADSGAVTKNEVNRRRTLDATVRVGDYGFDNSNFTAAQSSQDPEHSHSITLDDDYGVLRRQIWLATDGAYKNAISTLAEKKVYLEKKIQPSTVADFTRGQAFSREKPLIPLTVEKRDEMAMLVGNMAKLLLKSDRILKSGILLKMNRENVYYADSEGVRSIEPCRYCRLVITASAKADDGMPLKNFLIYTFTDPDGAPAEEKLAADVEGMIGELLALRHAPVVEDYSGPIVFEKQAAAEFLARGFVSHLTAKRSLQSNISLFDKKARKMENPFLRKVGLKVIGQSISIKTEPMQSTYSGISLLGSYGVDDEGTAAQEVSLVEGGFLKNFMSSRAPVANCGKSNGHFRDFTIAPSVIEVTSAHALGHKELKGKLLAAIKDEGLKYGYIVRSILPPELGDDEDGGFASLVLSRSSMGPSEFELSRPVMLYRVYPDGREELVRGAELGKMNVSIFKDVSGVSDDAFVYNYTVNFSDLRTDAGISESAQNEGDTYATLIAPSLMLPEAELSMSSDSYIKPPIVRFPLQAR